MEAGQRLTGDGVVRILEQVCAVRGVPRTIHVDNGPKFISRSLDLWGYWNKVQLDSRRPGTSADLKVPAQVPVKEGGAASHIMENGNQ